MNSKIIMTVLFNCPVSYNRAVDVAAEIRTTRSSATVLPLLNSTIIRSFATAMSLSNCRIIKFFATVLSFLK